MSFSDDVAKFGMKVQVVTKEVFVNVAAAAKDSITDGSPVTGSPGQPVDTGALKNSWQLELTSPTEARISTNIAYAESNEDGIARPGGGPYTLRSPVGGRHSVALTVLGLDRLVAVETAKVSQ